MNTKIPIMSRTDVNFVVQIRSAELRDKEFIVSLVPRLVEFGPPSWRDIQQMTAADIQIINDKLDNHPAGTAIFIAEDEKGTAIRERKPATVVREMAVISKIFSLALNNDYVDYNPCQRVEKPKFHNVGRRKLKDGDDEKFFAAFKSEWAHDICRTIVNTGLRQSDATGLLWSGVDWEEEEIRLVQDKTGREVVIPMNGTVKEILRRRLAQRTCELVFPSPKSGGRGLSVKTAIKGAVKRSKVSRITVHDLRRTAASRLLDAGANHITIAAILGHTDLRMILRYAQSSKAKRKAVKSLEKRNRAKIVPKPEYEKALTRVSA